jgi:sec-independent protein translocase protein TatC
MKDVPDVPAIPPAEPRREGQDEIDASKAPLMEHLIELRQRLIYSLVAFLVTFIACYAVAKYIYAILTWPLTFAGPNVRMLATGLLEELFTYIRVAAFGAMFLSFPFVALQIYKFVAPGLYKNEKQAFRPYLMWTWVMFVLGALVVFFVVMPLVVRFSFGDPGTQKTFDLMPRISEYLTLIMQLIMGFGIIFQLPVILALLAQAGIVTAQNLRDFSRYAIVGITAVAAVLSPPDPFSMLAMMAPTVGLYYASIFIVDRIEKAKALAEKTTTPAPM